MMGLTVSQKPVGFDLMQNCDLPPPSKVFKGSHKMVLLSMKQQFSNDFVTYPYEGDGSCDVLELLKALRSSQTRAREAEKKTAILIEEKDSLSNALLKEAIQLYAYRQQVRLLHLQVSKLQSLCCCATPEGAEGSTMEDDDSEERASLAWILALALSWGIGVGTAIAYRYFL